MSAKPAPVADWVTIAELSDDPFPTFERLRAEGGVHWVPAVNRYLITSYEAVHLTELDQETFSANEEGSLQIRAMGHSMLRRDDPEHYVERKAWEPALRPGTVKRVWMDVFRRNASHYLEELIEKGSGADLIADFAAPYASENLREVIGLHNATQEDLQRWSQTMIDATGNYADDPRVWELGKASYDEVDAALDEMLVWHGKHLDDNPSLIAQLLRSPEELMPLESIRANMKMTIGGGLNEPRDAIGVATWALLTHPEQRTLVEQDSSLWTTVFEETIRWVAPIGMYSRQTTRETELTGVALPAGAKLGICLLSANRDKEIWARPDRFDLRREVKPHLAFGKGTHVCLGSWMARAEVADVALPLLFDRLQDLRIDPADPAEISGWVFRGMTKLPALWDGVAEPPSSMPTEVEDHTPHRIAIVGAGPSGSFTAQSLLREAPHCEIDVYEAQPVPFGLIRYGVAPDHQGTKSVARQFEKLYAHPAVRFIGNVRVGTDVAWESLREDYDAVVVATGLHEDAPLPVPGNHLEGVVGAGALTRDLNAHPAATPIASLGDTVAVVGHGNVALDIARLLARSSFDGSDIDDAAHARVAGSVHVIHLIGRSAPESAKFDPVMVRELATMPGVQHLVHGVDVTADRRADARVDAVNLLAEAAPAHDARVRIEWWFGTTPEEILGDQRVEGIRVSSPTGQHTLTASSVVTAIGFEHDSVDLFTNALADRTDDRPTGRVDIGLYTAGWLRRGPRGTIPDQREDSRQLAKTIVDDLRARAPHERPRPEVPAHATDYVGWQRIDATEHLLAAPGRVRHKLRDPGVLLRTARDTSITVSARDGATASEWRLPVPLAIAYATESGGAQFAAEELHEALAGAENDVKLVDLAEVSAGDLDTDRFHVVLCSSYGDGELPTGVRDFVDSLGSGGVRAREADFSRLHYAVFGLGDRSYAKTYSRGSEILAELFDRCGAVRVGEFGRHDAGSGTQAADAALDWFMGIAAELQSRELVGARVPAPVSGCPMH